MKTVILNVILTCTKCRRLVHGESYSDYIARIHAVPFPQPVTPYRCEECR